VARNLLSIMAGRMRNNNLALIASQSLSLEFEQASSVDALTGIHNRRWLRDAYPRAITRCERDDMPVCLLLAGIDSFQQFNHRFGHLAGDTVLRRVARRLSDGLRTQDLIARYGGEEFLMLLPRCRLDDALLVAERLRSLVAAGYGNEEEPDLPGITLSCGVAEMCRGESLDDMASRVELALLRAKDNGRDRVERA
jgi:diguanylate cyclase (GGDEF)-like protein